MSVTTFPVMFRSLGQCLVKLENKWAFVWKHFENNTFFLLFFASSTKLSILHGGWKSASLEAICWMLMHKIFKPEGFCKMVKRVHMHFGTTMHSSLHMQSYLRNHSCRFQMISQFNLGKNLSWTQLILPAEMHAISNSKQVALEEYYCLKGLQILT